MRNDGTMYTGFYDRQLVVTVSSEPGSPSSTVPEDKQIIPDDNILNYEILPGMTDRIIRISVSIRVADLYIKFKFNDVSYALVFFSVFHFCLSHYCTR